MNEVINEGDACWIVFELTDKDGGTPESPPASLTYKIDCRTSGTSILAETQIVPPVIIGEIAITSAQNALVNQINQSELRRVLLKAVFGTGDAIAKAYYYNVQNIGE